MHFDTKTALRIAAIGATALVLLLLGFLIGTHILPRVVTVERRIVAPAMQAIQPSDQLGIFTNLIRTACPAVVTIEDSGRHSSAAHSVGANSRCWRFRAR